MALEIYQRSIIPDTSGGASYEYVGRLEGGVHIPSILESPEAAELLGEGEHELIVGFAAPDGVRGSLSYLKHKRVTIGPPPTVSPRVLKVEAL